MVLDPADKARALGAAQAIAMDKAARESDVERGVAADAEWEGDLGADAAWASTPTREIPGSETNSAACKPPSKN
jgi:hypothetical protein